MKILENLKLDTWYGVIFYWGVLLIAASLYFKIEFLEEKHLFGFGLGLILRERQVMEVPQTCATSEATFIKRRKLKLLNSWSPFFILLRKSLNRDF
ncbi:MAG: hypothetical protein HY033_06830 [Ignavibacteriae bacterium]|nr:hypothetical protein [Ignavibacteria bacterium]MBI3364606.1 hypothetical protein [Ignavibacteriota bacterium]